MKTYSAPSTILSIREDEAIVKIVKDERQSFGNIRIILNEAGFERFSGLIDEYNCDGLKISYDSSNVSKRHDFFSLDLKKVTKPENITDLSIGTVGKFAPDFDFDTFERFQNVKSLSVESIPFADKMVQFFPKLETLKIFDWAKNKIKDQNGLWPHLRCLQVVNFRGDLSTFAGWKIQVLFLYGAKIESFSTLHLLPDLVTLRTEKLNSHVDLSSLNDLVHLKHFSLWMPRNPPKISGLASRSLELMMLEKIDQDDLATVDFRKNLPNLKLYRIDLGRNRRLDHWEGFRQYGDPFASVSSIWPYPPE